mmetsp:Transcript_27210/g.55979  ORF Transcript_27210/g.55979 Transcript_27210/m.55979 type:complete len:765 (-) Transcript_27210:612-2906(-)
MASIILPLRWMNRIELATIFLSLAMAATLQLCYGMVNSFRPSDATLSTSRTHQFRPPQRQRPVRTKSTILDMAAGRKKSDGNSVSPSVSSSSTSRKSSSSTLRRSSDKRRQRNATWSDEVDAISSNDDEENTNSRQTFIKTSPFPSMPSPLFINLAQSQFELLSNSLVHSFSENESPCTNNAIKPGTPKISSMALYLPKENLSTGQLEFVPIVTYPNPSSERVFIASDSSSFNDGIHEQSPVQYPPTIPWTAVRENPTKGLPGFTKASDLIPSYPFVSSSQHDDIAESGSEVSSDGSIGVSTIEEISIGSTMEESNPKALSVTLFNGMETLGVLMIWPYRGQNLQQQKLSMDGRNQTIDIQEVKIDLNEWTWTSNDKLQVARAAKSIALALSMDNERASTQMQSEQFRVALADSLHQVKSPLQALRTFGKLLQRQLAEEYVEGTRGRHDRGMTGNKRPTMQRVPMTAFDGDLPYKRRQRHALKLAEDMMAQGERVVDLIEPMDELVQSRGGYKLNGRYLLNPKKDETPSSGALILLPSRADGPIYGTSLKQHTRLPTHLISDFNIEIAFPQDVLGPTVYASQAISLEQGINFDAVGFDPNAELPGVSVCPKLLQEAVSNILDNAIKYTPLRIADMCSSNDGEESVSFVRQRNIARTATKRKRKESPEIKVTLTANEPPLSAGATLYIEDNGPGIPKSERDRVFERGYRNEAVHSLPGSGLGLGISKEIINHMGGIIDILEEGPSKMGGTTVRVIVFRDPEQTNI